MISYRLSVEADAAARRYDQLVDNWQALYSRALASIRFGYEGHIQEVASEAYQIAEVYFEDEKDHIARLLSEIALEAHQSVLQKIASIAEKELPDSALAHLSVTQSFISDEIVSQMHRDIAMLRRELQRSVLNVSMIVRTRGLSERKALMEYRVSNSESLNFTFQDRKFRKTQSRTYIRALWRQTLLAVHNEIVMMALSDHGIGSAAVMKIDNGIATQIDSINLTGEDQENCYSAVCADYFHPNSNAWLDMETLNV